MAMTFFQKYWGLFRSELLLKTLAHHFSCANGQIRVPALGPAKDIDEPKGAVAMAATAVSL
jgi:hypothetical protein